MSDERDNQRPDGKDSGSDVPAPSSGNLLELIQSAEDEARVATGKRPKVTTPAKRTSDRPAENEEEFVDVGDEAVDAPPSFPPLRAPTPAKAFGTTAVPAKSTDAEPKRASSASRTTSGPKASKPGLPPSIGIPLLLALVIAALALFTR